MKRLLAGLMFLFLIGCVTTQPTIQRIPFPSDEYSKLEVSGTSIIKGQAFLKTRAGDVKTAAGNEVLLNPVTSYSNQWYEENYIKGRLLTEINPKMFQYVKKKIADAEGRFIFKDVPAGEYYLTTVVTWEAPVGYNGSLVRQGGHISEKISVKDKDELDIILTK